MGLIFKKTIKLGLFNINLSKSGVSTSWGFKGFRMNSKGQYRAGTGNLYYQGRWDKKQTTQDKGNTNWKRIFWIILFGILLWRFSH